MGNEEKILSINDRIEEIARKKTNQEYKEFLRVMRDNKFAKELKLKVGEKEIPLAENSVNWAIFNAKDVENENSKYTNLDEVYNKIYKENLKKETDDLISKLGMLKEFLDGER